MSKKILISLDDETYKLLRENQNSIKTSYEKKGCEYNKSDAARCRDIIKNYLEKLYTSKYEK